MLLYIVRHGEPNYETDCLTENGRLQAEAVGKRIAASGIDVIYSSPMGRARETAAPACRLLGLPCNIEDWTHEVEDDRLTPYPDGVMKSISFVPFPFTVLTVILICPMTVRLSAPPSTRPI